MARARSADAYGSCAITCIPKPLARLATSEPTFPKPITARHPNRSIEYGLIRKISRDSEKERKKWGKWVKQRKEVTSFERGIGLGDVAGHGSDIDDEASVLGCGPEINVVDPDPSAANDTEPTAGRLEDLAADLRAATHDKGIAEGDLGAELLLREVVGAIHVGKPFEDLQTRLPELLRHQYRGLCPHPSRSRHHNEAAPPFSPSPPDGNGGPERDATRHTVGERKRRRQTRRRLHQRRRRGSGSSSHRRHSPPLLPTLCMGSLSSALSL
ncbi:unnamed protein product [Spirodela intermedia]|uniref:Uncharacterized protein n=1 Tax=Spirodela intermedia TaxID=51605 RepID=A0A7I8LID1_SPIIN|nr:unnamed protein product [Spirodela intermedia]